MTTSCLTQFDADDGPVASRTEGEAVGPSRSWRDPTAVGWVRHPIDQVFGPMGLAPMSLPLPPPRKARPPAPPPAPAAGATVEDDTGQAAKQQQSPGEDLGWP